MRGRLVPATPAGPFTFPETSLDLELAPVTSRLSRTTGRIARFLLPLLAMTLFTSTMNGDSHLVGSWSHQGKDMQQLIFNGDGTAVWTIDAPELQGEFTLRYKVDYGTLPLQVTLEGFTEGPLKGRALYGIAEIQQDGSLAFDWVPGRSGQDQVRPDYAGSRAVVYSRAL